MSSDPNNTRWSQSDKSFGKNLLRKSGWNEGEGLGKGQEGVTQHVKVSKKDDTMGLGYQAGVGDTWSAQSVGFADVLDRIKRGKIPADDSDQDEEASSVLSKSGSPTSPVGSKYHAMYAKRNALKTEGLQSGSAGAKEEILGKKRARSGTSESSLSVDAESTLKSSTLKRLMIRCAAVEPKPTAEGEVIKTVIVTKPDPRPPRCSDTPFLASEEQT